MIIISGVDTSMFEANHYRFDLFTVSKELFHGQNTKTTNWLLVYCSTKLYVSFFTVL